MRSFILSTALTSLIVNVAHAESASYFQRNAEGWFWYEVEPEPAPEETPPPEPPPMVLTIPPTDPPAPPPEARPTMGSVAWMREAMPAALDAAMDNPTDENIERYFMLQRMAIDRSEIFAERARMVTTGHPELDEGMRRPRQDVFSRELEELAEIRKREVLARFFETNALILFMDASCSSCALMGENFYRMQQTHGLVWQTISMDGTLLPPEMSDNQSFDAGLSEQLGVSSGGAVFIASPPNTFIPVTWNPTGGAEVADRILLVARRAGLISDDDFRLTQAINPRVSNVTPNIESAPSEVLNEADQLIQPFTYSIIQQEPAQ